MTTRSEETWAAPGIEETRAGSLTLVPIKASLYMRKIIHTNEKSGLLFMLIQEMEVIWQCLLPKPSRKCYVISTKTHDRLMVQDFNSVSVRKFAYEGARDFSDEAWLQKIFEGSTKRRIEYCEDKYGILGYLRAIQGHSGGVPMEPQFIEDSHGTSSPHWEMDRFQEKKRKIKTVRQSFKHQRILLKMTWRKTNVMTISQFHRRYLT